MRDLHRRYGALRAVDGVSFEVPEGEIFALLGPNGAGKTTTIRMILGLVSPSAGSVRVLGSDRPSTVRDAIGYLPEERGLYRDVKVLDNLVYLAGLKGITGAEARRRAMASLEQLALDHVAGQPVKSLSRGMQQQVQLIATIIHRPKLLIVDEPFSGLDPVNTRRMRDLLLRLRDAGATIVMSTHQMNRVEEICDRLVMLQRGSVVLEGTVRSVRRQFGGGSVLVEADGSLEDLPGVARSVPVGDGFALTLKPGVRPDDLLTTLAARSAIGLRRFEVHTPHLEEVFIAVAGASPDDEQDSSTSRSHDRPSRSGPDATA